MDREASDVPDRSEGRLTDLIHLASGGDELAAGQVVAETYAELRRNALSLMRRQAPWHTLETDALVNEAYLRVMRSEKDDWQNRGHFICVMSRAMRQVLMDHAKGKRAEKRGGNARRVALTGLSLPFQDRTVDLLTLNDALDRLYRIDVRAAQVVELKFLVGLAPAEVAEALGTSRRSIERDWNFASTWLRGELGR